LTGINFVCLIYAFQAAAYAQGINEVNNAKSNDTIINALLSIARNYIAVFYVNVGVRNVEFNKNTRFRLSKDKIKNIQV